LENVIVGRHPVREALRSGRPLNRIWFAAGTSGGSLEEIKSMALENKIPVQKVPRSRLDKIAGRKNHQGIAASVAVKGYVALDDLIAPVPEKAPLIFLLDGVSDPQNFGALLRVADAVGASGVVVQKRRGALLTPAVGKASAGAVEHVPVARVTNLARAVDFLKENNLWVVGADAKARKTFWDTDLKGPLALVVGSEGRGLGRLVREKCDYLVSLPMAGKTESLNVAVAAAVLAYEVVRQRREN